MENHGPKDESYGDGVIAGRNPVAEALRSGRAVDCVYVAKGPAAGPLSAILAKAKKLGVPIKECDPRKLSHMCNGANHQGIVALAAAVEYSSLEDMLARLTRGESPPCSLSATALRTPTTWGR